MRTARPALDAIAAWRREAGVAYQAVFVLSLALLGASFAAGFVASWPHFGLPPAFADATILGRALLARGDYLPALEEFRLAGLIDPENYDSSPELSFASSSPDAEALVRRGRQRVRQRPDDARAHLLLGRALLGSGHAAESIDSLWQARTLDPRLPGLNGLLGRALLEAGPLAEAETAYREAIATEPRNPDWHDGLALVLYRSSQHDEAKEHFRIARSLREAGTGRSAR